MLSYSPDGTYSGERLDGRPHGRGTMLFADGSEYTGQWWHGVPHGRGIYHCAEGEYTGQWQHGTRHGQGRMTFADGGSCEGTMFEPTALTDTSPEMAVNREELFAPVITIGAYDDFDQAIALANDTDFGLQSGLFTQNMNRIMRAFDEVQVGGLQVNDVSTFRVDQMPYGGVKGSGVGREGPLYAIEEMSETKLMVVNLPGGRV